MFYRQYYSELGKLLYALAHADGKIGEKEKAALKELVRTELVPKEKHNDTFGTDAAYYAEIEFDILEDSEPDVDAAFDSFLFFIENHHTAVTTEMRQATIRVTDKMAHQYKNTGKKEASLLATLKKKLQELPAAAH
ncbi:MAG TPA: hypothetical protein VG603_04375 [Chitinophagales bacterium]|nr:hypothetical protein [Chitinophagales bacterium]